MFDPKQSKISEAKYPRKEIDPLWSYRSNYQLHNKNNIKKSYNGNWIENFAIDKYFWIDIRNLESTEVFRALV